jgi:hypothetical protein
LPAAGLLPTIRCSAALAATGLKRLRLVAAAAAGRLFVLLLPRARRDGGDLRATSAEASVSSSLDERSRARRSHAIRRLRSSSRPLLRNAANAASPAVAGSDGLPMAA